MKYVKLFETTSAFNAFKSSNEFVTPHVSLCEDNPTSINYEPYVAPVQLFDILWSDGTTTSNIRPTSDNVIPIGLCIAPKGFFGPNENARFMSLKFMNYTTPETGSISIQDMYWGSPQNISNLKNITQVFKDCDTLGGYLYVNEEYLQESNQYGTQVPPLFTENDEWNISMLGTVNDYAMTDIDGKNNTSKITAYAKYDWQTSESITNSSSQYGGYYPAACCCARYHTLGTQAGDWYLGGCGEIAIMISKVNEINAKLASINIIYPNDCINSITPRPNDLFFYWTSTIYNNMTWHINQKIWQVWRNGSRDQSYHYVIALLQY